MRSVFDDELFDHRKIIKAGIAVGGYHGIASALGLYTAGILYANRHLTDGFLDRDVVLLWPHSKQMLSLTKALETAKLWEAVDGGWRIHDFDDHNWKASKVKDKRRKDRQRKREARTQKDGL